MILRTTIALLLFILVATASFAFWAFGDRLFTSEPALYTACALVFFGLGGLALVPGLPQEDRKAMRFSISFALGFLSYAVLWSLLWFSLPTTLGEVIGSSLGILALVAIFKKRHHLSVPFLPAIAVVFLFHTLGYYLGDFAYSALQGRGPVPIELDGNPKTIRTAARLSWGIFYGLGLGAGILALFQARFSRIDNPSTQI